MSDHAAEARMPNCDARFARLEHELQHILAADFSGHDFEHALRVQRLSTSIAEVEGGDGDLIRCLALVHDMCRPWEIRTGKSHFGPEALAIIDQTLTASGFDAGFRERALDLVAVHDKYGDYKHTRDTLELQIVQDADRLDAIGAVGIARAFAFGGALSLPMIHRAERIDPNATFEERTTGRTSVFGHFSHKLIKLADSMHTATGRRMAHEKHDFLLTFMAQFSREAGL